jgi:hypothetical protein
MLSIMELDLLRENIEDFQKFAVILMFPSLLPDVPFAFTKYDLYKLE